MDPIPSARPRERSFLADPFESPLTGEDFRALVEASGDLLTVLDGAGRILYDNPAVEDLLGYRQGELVGRSAFELIHPSDYAAAVSMLAELAAGTRRAGALVFRYRARSGGWRWLESRGRVAAGVQGDARIVVTSREHPDAGGDEPTGEGGAGADELEEARVEVVERLARAAEFRDDDTGQHLRRVGELAHALGRRVGLPGSEVGILRRAAPLHDVGKIGIPDAILRKPGPLLPAEEEVMRTHPLLGARILEGGASALVQAAEAIALSHHERWDGRGYPWRLAGEEIPLSARIVSLVDFYDALTHDRPYRRAWEPRRVVELIRGESGTRFQPELATAFVELIEETAAADPEPPPAGPPRAEPTRPPR